MLPEVAEFDAFALKWGKLGGWHPDDHAEFLRSLTNPCKEGTAGPSDLAARLFHLSLSDIEAHSRFYLCTSNSLKHCTAQDIPQAWIL